MRDAATIALAVLMGGLWALQGSVSPLAVAAAQGPTGDCYDMTRYDLDTKPAADYCKEFLRSAGFSAESYHNKTSSFVASRGAPTVFYDSGHAGARLGCGEGQPNETGASVVMGGFPNGEKGNIDDYGPGNVTVLAGARDRGSMSDANCFDSRDVMDSGWASPSQAGKSKLVVLQICNGTKPTFDDAQGQHYVSVGQQVSDAGAGIVLSFATAIYFWGRYGYYGSSSSRYRGAGDTWSHSFWSSMGAGDTVGEAALKAGADAMHAPVPGDQKQVTPYAESLRIISKAGAPDTLADIARSSNAGSLGPQPVGLSKLPVFVDSLAGRKSNDVWAVGYHTGNQDIAHWDGSRWTVFATPSGDQDRKDFLSSVATLSTKDVWAVGDTSSGGTDGPLMVHWDGRKWGDQSPVSYFHDGQIHLNGVAGAASDDIWAVGTSFHTTCPAYGEADLQQAVITHWDGLQWTARQGGDCTSGTHLTLAGVAATSKSDAWAVGSDYRAIDANLDSVGHGGVEASSPTAINPLIEHWDGTTWFEVRTPALPPGPGGGEFTSVAALSTNDVWAGGHYMTAAGDNQALLEHWDGKAWTITPTADSGARVLSIAARSPYDVWAVGERALKPSHANPSGVIEPMIQHWDGNKWSNVRTRNAQPECSLRSALSFAANNALAIGYSLSSGYRCEDVWAGSGWTETGETGP